MWRGSRRLRGAAVARRGRAVMAVHVLQIVRKVRPVEGASRPTSSLQFLIVFRRFQIKVKKAKIRELWAPRLSSPNPLFIFHL